MANLQRRVTGPVQIPKVRQLNIQNDINGARRYWQQRSGDHFFRHGLELVEEAVRLGAVRLDEDVSDIDRRIVLLSLYHGLGHPRELPFSLRAVIGQELRDFCFQRSMEEKPDKEAEDWRAISKHLKKVRIATLVRVLDNGVSARADAEGWELLSQRGEAGGTAITADNIPEVRRALARSHLSIAYPMAEGFGFHGMADDLRTFAIRSLHPEAHMLIETRLADANDLGGPIQRTIEQVREILEGIKTIMRAYVRNEQEIAQEPRPVRKKNAASVLYTLMQKYGMPAEETVDSVQELFDLAAGMVCVPEHRKYEVVGIIMGLLKARYPQLTVKDEDYFKHPKPTGYRGYHVEVNPHRAGICPFEIQIHTPVSLDMYNRGGAAHHLFKAENRQLMGDVLMRYQHFVTGLALRTE